MARDYQTLYYEQQASHTEARGMLCAERDEWKRKYEEAVARLSEERRWIPVTERLPEHGGDYLCLITEFSDVWAVCEFFNVTRTWVECFTEDSVDVAHWMPLPEAPK